MQLDGLIALGDYKPPALPTEERFRNTLTHLKAMFLARAKNDVIAEERLETPSLKRLDEAAHPPACGPMLKDLTCAMTSWLEQPVAAGTILAIILPPTDENDVIGAWAKESDLHLIDPPHSRTGTFTHPDQALLENDEPVVVPRLERWFLRSPAGLERVRVLMECLTKKRRVVVGCNSFAWAFLSKTVRIDLIAPGPFTFRPFDGPTLENWLVSLTGEEIERGARFRLAHNGSDLLGKDAAEGSADFFATLAGRSRGVPWIAWHMWRDQLRFDERETRSSHDTAHEAAAARRTFWIAALEELVIPGNYPRELLFALHALSLHGPLEAAELLALLPEGAGPAIVPALRSSSFIDYQNDRLSVRPEAYPAIRGGLQAAGFPVGAV